MMADEQRLREAICEVGNRLWVQRLVAATDGNVSVRLGPGRYLCTPSGVSVGHLTPEDIVVADDRGEWVSGRGKPTSEFYTHLAAYEERPDVAAVVHAHPLTAVSLTVAGLSLTEPLVPEVVYHLGGIPTAPYATPGTGEGAGSIRTLIRQCDALLMDRHGALAVDIDVFGALHKIEKVEYAAEIFMRARSLGCVRPLEPEHVQRILALRAERGGHGQVYPSGSC